MIVSIKEFQNYTNVITENESLFLSFIFSAQNIISDYLGYNPEKQLLNPQTGILENVNIETEIPEIIKLTIMRIGALLLSESDSNIGVTSKSFSDSGTRTFINTVNYDKYLIQISQYRIIRI